MAAPPPLVLHVIHHLYTGGLENGLVNLINHMPAEKFRHAIACVEDFNEFRNRIRREDTAVFALHRSKIGVWNLRKELYGLCRRLRPAIVHTRNQSGLDALLPARLAGVRHCVHSEHGWDVDNLRGEKWKPNLNRRLHSPLVSHYVTVSKDLQNYLTARVGISWARITQIYNGVDTDRYVPGEAKPSGIMPGELLGPDALVIGSVGRIQAVKDHATLIKAFHRLLQLNPGWRPRLRLAIVGDGPLLDEIRQLALSLDVMDRCWFPGAHEDVPSVLRLFDVFVLPSLNEGISNTILEAMASGLPLVVTGVGGNVELVDEGVTGSFFSPGAVESLATLLQDYIANPAMRHAQGEAARRAALARFSLQSMVANYQGVYEGLGSSA